MKGICSWMLALIAVTAPAAHAADRAEVRTLGDAVYYRGDLEEHAVARVADLLKQPGHALTQLVIDSGGGEINLGMDLADLVLAHRLDVVVERLCASSCANYVFPAGKRKRIAPDSLVVWHGSAIQADIDEAPGLTDADLPPGIELNAQERQDLLDRRRQYLEDARVRQRALFARLGADERVTVIGQQLAVAAEWTLSIRDMQRFGIGDVVAPPHYARCLLPAAADTASRCSEFRRNGIQLLALDEHPDVGI